MSLSDWHRNDWLVAHETSPQEIAELLSISERDLRDCLTEGLSPDWRLAIAYNSALQSASAALAAAGYRASREMHHYRIIQSLTFTVRADAEFIAKFDAFRKKRNISDYERSGAVSDQEAGEMFLLAKQLKEMVEKWIREDYPELLKSK
ncbi:MAG: hypothetical protein A2Y69_04890 [Candidatus Aminicenantes bacterium RBG_13_59_9]|nr:MAG: hypothetical protein A2Y69_04890 [Candidatus Aminicenantes bacterium RBG_13_59_9]